MHAFILLFQARDKLTQQTRDKMEKNRTHIYNPTKVYCIGQQLWILSVVPTLWLHLQFTRKTGRRMTKMKIKKTEWNNDTNSHMIWIQNNSWQSVIGLIKAGVINALDLWSSFYSSCFDCYSRSVWICVYVYFYV